ncbi:MAG: hypothetical protein HQK52_12300 [Oligoflexia bacterium]|nr:hypothetical protein [Oligoflexia bacterium]
MIFLQFTVLSLLAILYSSCIPTQQQKMMKGSCGNDYYFDSKTRSCQKRGDLPSPPKNTLTAVTVDEDTPKIVELTYADSDSDYATLCNVSGFAPSFLVAANGACSCYGGYCSFILVPGSNLSGIGQFLYTVTDKDGSSDPTIVKVEITPVNDAPITGTAAPYGPSLSSTFKENDSATFRLYYQESDDEKASACEIVMGQSRTPNAGTTTNNAFESSSCSCNSSSGLCTVTISGRPEINPPDPIAIPTVIEYFTYRVKSKNDWSEYSDPNFYALEFVNNLPTPLGATPMAVPTEGFTQLKYTLYYSEAEGMKANNCQIAAASGFTFAGCDCSAPIDASSKIGHCELTLVNNATPIAYSNSAVSGYKWNFLYSFQDSFDDQWGSSPITPVSILVTPYNNLPVAYNTPDTQGVIEGVEATVGPFVFDEGGMSDEDAQTLKIRVSTNNPALIANSGITIFANGTPLASANDGSTWVSIGDASADATAFPLTLKMVPLDYRSGTAIATVAVIDDGENATPMAFSFALAYTPVNDPPSVKIEAPLVQYNSYEDSSYCDDPSTKFYHEACFGNYGINIEVTPNYRGQIIYDYRAKQNYVYTGTYWQRFLTTCPITDANDAGDPHCARGASNYLNCVGDGAPSFISSASGKYFFDYVNNDCYKSNESNTWDIVTPVVPTPYCPYDSGYADAGAPTSVRGTPIASEKNKIYQDTTSNRCYYAVYEAPAATPTAYWNYFKTNCAFSKNGCQNVAQNETFNCIGPRAPQWSEENHNAYTYIPSAGGKYYYDSANKVCYTSLATYLNRDAINWVVYGEVLPDVKGNNGQRIIMSNLRIDEGMGNDVTSEKVSMSIRPMREYRTDGGPNIIDCSNTGMIAYCNGYPLEPTVGADCASEGITWPLQGTNCPGAEASPGDLEDAYKNIEVHFRPKNYGRAEMNMTLRDDGVPAAATADYFFSLIIYPITAQATYPFWKSAIALGNKVTNEPTPNTALRESTGVKLSWNTMRIPSTTYYSNASESKPPVDPTRSSYSSANVHLSGYNIYRRTAGTPFYDFNAPLNATPIDPDVRSYVDKGRDTPPGRLRPSTIYYYTVRGVDSLYGNLVKGDEEIRVIVPPENMSFVHRSLANYEVCTSMPKATPALYMPEGAPAAAKNYKCEYSGPGEVIPSGTRGEKSYYDVESDLFVDRFEAGCPIGTFSESAANLDLAAVLSAGCNGDVCYGEVNWNSTPIALSAVAGKRYSYYSRSSGQCLVSVGTEWRQFNSDDNYPTTSGAPLFGTPVIPNAINRAHLPPLTNISQFHAHELCQNRGPNKVYITDHFNDTTVANVIAIPSPKLPSRKEQIAYSSWDNNNNNDDETLDALETGNSLNASNKCNSSGASGLTSDYTDSSFVPFALYHTLPGTSSCLSGPSQNQCIRSLITGSAKTANSSLTTLSGCLSRYGIQDSIGNVKEWVEDRIYCITPKLCVGVFAGSAAFPAGYSGYPCRFSVENEVSVSDSYTCANSTRGDQHCVGDNAPDASVVATPVSLLFFDRVNDKCYAHTDPDAGWFNLNNNTSCPITSTAFDPGYGELNFLTELIPDINTIIPVNVGTYHFDISAKVGANVTGGTCQLSHYDPTNNVNVWTEVTSFYGTSNIKPTPLNGQKDFRVDDTFFYYWALDGRTGPFDSATGIFPLNGWYLADRDHDAGKFIFPMGLPSTTYFTSNFPSSSVYDFLLDIGSSSGITTDALHNDYFSVNSQSVYANDRAHCGAMATGGSHLSGNKAGRFAADFYPCNVDATPTPTISAVSPTAAANIGSDVGFRCLLKVPTPIPASYYTD